MPNIQKPPCKTLRQSVIGICIILAVVTLVVFGQTVNAGFINFDDPEYVVNNPLVTQGLTFKGIAWAFSNFHAANWHPLTWISHMLDCQFYGLDAGGHHLTSVIIHIGVVIALFLVLLQMTDALWPSAFVAAVFAIHPLRAESVAWVSERKDVLSGLFFMLTISAYVRYARHPWSAMRYGLVLLLFVLGLLCKPMLVTLPLVLLLLDYWPLQRAKPAWQLSVEKLPLLALSAISCLVTLLAQKHAISPFETYPLRARLVTAVLSCKVYLFQMVYPAGLAAFYPFPHSVSIWEKLTALVLLAVISVLGWEERRKRPWLLVGWLWYLVMLLPVAGIIQVGDQSHADRYTYLPQIGIYVAITWLATELGALWRVDRVAMGGLMGVITAALMLCAWKQAGYWKNSETLWRHALACTTDNTIAYVNLGHELYEEGRLDETMALYQKALQIEPDNAELHNNFANALRKSGKQDEALAEYEKAVQMNPGFAEGQFNLGKALSLEGKEKDAIAHFQITLQLEPDFLPARMSLGSALLQDGQPEQAARQFQQALEIQSNDASLHLNLGLCYLQMGQAADAKAQYEEALRLNPDDPRIQNNLAWLLAAGPVASLRDGNQAVELAREADEITGGQNPVILHTLAAALAQAGRFSEAIKTAQEASSLAEAQANPAMAKQLQSELKLYNAGQPFPFPQQTKPAEKPAILNGK